MHCISETKAVLYFSWRIKEGGNLLANQNMGVQVKVQYMKLKCKIKEKIKAMISSAVQKVQ